MYTRDNGSLGWDTTVQIERRSFTEKRNIEKGWSLGGKCIWFEQVRFQASFWHPGGDARWVWGSEFREVRLKISGWFGMNDNWCHVNTWDCCGKEYIMMGEGSLGMRREPVWYLISRQRRLNLKCGLRWHSQQLPRCIRGSVPGKKECLTVSHAAQKPNRMQGQCPLFWATWLLKSESCFWEVLWGRLIPLR